MIPYSEFASLRLSQFRPDTEITPLEDWEYEDRTWVGEAIGFSEWLRPADSPEVLGSLAIDFDEFPAPAAERVLQAIGLSVRPGMTIDELWCCPRRSGPDASVRPRSGHVRVPDRRTQSLPGVVHGAAGGGIGLCRCHDCQFADHLYSKNDFRCCFWKPAVA